MAQPTMPPPTMRTSLPRSRALDNARRLRARQACSRAKSSATVRVLRMRSATDAWLDLVWRRHRLVLVSRRCHASRSRALATRLELRTNVAELLPSKDPAVEELQYLSKRIGGTSILQIAIESPDRDANLRLAGALDRQAAQAAGRHASRARSTTCAPSGSSSCRASGSTRRSTISRRCATPCAPRSARRRTRSTSTSSTRIRPSRSSSACASAPTPSTRSRRATSRATTGASSSSSAVRPAACSPSAPARSWPRRPSASSTTRTPRRTTRRCRWA